MAVFYGILIPFLGTSLGAACVFFMKKSLGPAVQCALSGFAAGVMVAASMGSLLVPSIRQAAAMGRLAFVPAVVGSWAGILLLRLFDVVVPPPDTENRAAGLGSTAMMVLAVTLHNIPEGMAVGVVYAGYLAGNAQITAAGAMALSLGIAVQNFPEGAIISMPLRAAGMKKSKAFWGGVLSGAALSSELCRRGDALCRGRGAAPGAVAGWKVQTRGAFLRARLRHHDVAGRLPRLGHEKASCRITAACWSFIY